MQLLAIYVGYTSGGGHSAPTAVLFTATGLANSNLRSPGWLVLKGSLVINCHYMYLQLPFVITSMPAYYVY